LMDHRGPKERSREHEMGPLPSAACILISKIVGFYQQSQNGRIFTNPIA
jgi:hypothetical protein